MKEIVTKLLTVKSIVTFVLIGVTAYLAIVSKVEISPEFFASVVTAVITYYFTRKENTDDRQ